MCNGSGKNHWYTATRRVYLIDLIDFFYHIKDHAKFWFRSPKDGYKIAPSIWITEPAKQDQ